MNRTVIKKIHHTLGRANRDPCPGLAQEGHGFLKLDVFGKLQHGQSALCVVPGREEQNSCLHVPVSPLYFLHSDTSSRTCSRV